MYTWHFTFDGLDAVHGLASAYQDRLVSLPCLDLVPARWLHLTTQGVGFTDEVTEDEASAVVGAARERLKSVTARHVSIGPAKVTPEAILLDVSPAADLVPVRNELRAAITSVVGAERLIESPDWTPHVSVAYSNGNGSAAPFAEAVAGRLTADAVLAELELIVLGRDQHCYEWATFASIVLA